MNPVEQLPDDEEAPDEPECGGGDDGDPECLYEGETYLYPDRKTVCEKFGLLGMTVRDGFLYVFTINDGEVLFSDFLKKRGKGQVKAIK